MREDDLFSFFDRFGGTKPLFISFSFIYCTIHSYTFIHNIRSFRSSFFIAASLEGPHWGAVPRFELGADLQQTDTLPTEPYHTPNHAAPFSHATS